MRRETTGTPDRDQALAYLRRRVEEAARGTFIDRITFAGMRELLFENYCIKGNRTDPSRHVKNLEGCLGGLFGDEIDEARIGEYAGKRLDKDKVAPATVRRELAVLKRMLRLASRWLTRLPIIRMPRVDNSRQGFFEEDELQSLLPHLPAHARNLVEFLYLTGWRSGEAFRLTWLDVDWDRQIVRLRESKSREGRTFPFKYHRRLSALLARQRADVARWEREHGQLCLAVFHWRGRPMRKLRRSWRNACNAAGLPGRLLHDFRRTAV